MERFQATGTITINCTAEDAGAAEMAIRILVDQLRQTHGVHISIAEHHQKPGRIHLREIES